MKKTINRRAFLRSGLSGALAASLPARIWAAELPSDITAMTALQLSAAIKAKSASCEEVMLAYLAHIKRHNPVYNAIVSMPEEDSLLSQAEEADAALSRGEYRGWMHGMPHAVKDLEPVAGLRFTSGSPMFEDRVAEEDSAMAAKLRAAGAIFIGKTNVPEFGLGSQSYNQVFGPTASAWDPDLTSGGSSGGAASGLGTHMLPVADGSDMMGSLRNPGAFNNVIGFRPSVNVMSGVESDPMPLSTLGPMGRNTADTVALLNTIAASPLSGGLQTLELDSVKLAWMGNLGGYLAMEEGITDLCEDTLNVLSAAGAVVEAATPLFTLSDLWLCWTTLRHSGRASMRRYWEDPATREMLKPELSYEIEESFNITAGDTANAKRIRRAWYRELDRLFEKYDFLVLPTAQVFPYDKNLSWPRQIAGRRMDTYHRWMEVVMYGSLGGLPIVNVPVGFDAEGRPMGMQVMGPYGADKKVLEFAFAYEGLTDFLDRRPELVPAA